MPLLPQRVVILKSVAMKDPRLLFGSQASTTFKPATNYPSPFAGTAAFQGTDQDSGGKLRHVEVFTTGLCLVLPREIEAAWRRFLEPLDRKRGL
jgi:hypothetical protein